MGLGDIGRSFLRVLTTRIVADYMGNDPGLQEASAELARLLGYSHYDDLIRLQTEEDCRRMHLLLGSNGYVIYKIMKARHD
jgi:hypothetical protein